MKTYRIELTSESGILTPFQADTIFGHLCWVVANHEGDEGINNFLRPFKEGNPPFLLSDGFPGQLLPIPFSAEFSLGDPIQQKEMRKLRYLTSDVFDQMRRGEKAISSLQPTQVPGIAYLSTHNSISRVNSRTLSEGGVYSLSESFIPTVSIYIKVVSEDWKDSVVDLFRELSKSGYGKKKSIGKGHFIINDNVDEYSFDEAGSANGFVTLSSFCPKRTDPVHGAYKTFVKYGKLGDIFTFCGNPFKRPLVMIKTGSVFRTGGPPKEYYGRMIDNGIAPAKPEAVQYGYAFAIPISLNAEFASER
jgi:CRISPR-associated protein Csm4